MEILRVVTNAIKDNQLKEEFIDFQKHIENELDNPTNEAALTKSILNTITKYLKVQIQSDFEKIGLPINEQNKLFTLELNPEIEVKTLNDLNQIEKLFHVYSNHTNINNSFNVQREYEIKDKLGLVTTINDLIEVCFANSDDKFFYTLPHTFINAINKEDLIDNPNNTNTNLIQNAFNGVLKNYVKFQSQCDKNLSSIERNRILEEVEQCSFMPKFNQDKFNSVFVQHDLSQKTLIRHFITEYDLFSYFKDNGHSLDISNQQSQALFDKDKVDLNQIQLSTMKNLMTYDKENDVYHNPTMLSVKPPMRVSVSRI